MTILRKRYARVQVGPLDVSELRCVFRVERTFRKAPNQVSVKVYNLNDESRAAIEASRATAATGATDGLGHPVKRVFISLYVGYENQHFRTFYGDVRRIINTVEPPDVVTHVYGGDGEVCTMAARVNRSFSPGTTVEAVLRYLTGVLGVGVGNAVDMFRSAHLRDMRNFHDGTVLSGSAFNELDMLCAAGGFDWSIQDNALLVLPLGQALGDSGVDLTPETGLIGSPTRDPVTRVVRAKCNIIPNVVPGRRVHIKSTFLDQVIRVNKTTLAGDTHGQEWSIDLEGRAPLAPLFRR